MLDATIDPAHVDEISQPLDAVRDQSPTLPLIRSHEVQVRFALTRYVLGIWPDRIVAGKVKRLRIDVDLARDGDPACFNQIRWSGRHTDGPPNTLESVTVFKRSGNARFEFRSLDGVTNDIEMPLGESENVIAALEGLLQSRLRVQPGVGEELAALKSRRLTHVAKHRKSGRIGIPPFRSYVTGVVFKVAGIVLLASGVAFWFRSFGGATEETAAHDFFLAGLSLLIMGNIAFRIGRRVGARSYEEVIARDRRAPVLFLRSFDSEDVESPTPGAPRREKYASRLFNQIPFAFLVQHALLSAIRFVYSLQGTFAERVEEQLARVVRRVGPMTAIGEPGERIAAAGAARAYVSNDDWQSFILDQMNRSSMVLIQVEPSIGTWWEFERCVALVSPERLLIMLTSNYGSPTAYEAIRSKAVGLLPKTLPPYLGDAGFVMFDADWTPTLLPLRFHPPFLRHVMPSMVNYRRSIAPFVARIADRGGVR